MSEPEVAVDTTAFAELRPLLFSVAYRMLGRATDAEDILQEAWLRYACAAASGVEVRDLRSWSVRVVTRLCLDELRSVRVQREHYVGPWLPEPVFTGEATDSDPLAVVERRDLLSLGALALLERLSPTERAVLVLREAVGLSHAEIARTVEITEVASRQLLARARRHVVDSPARSTPSREEHRRLVDVLDAAFKTGDVEPLVALMREDVVLVSDAGGEVKAPRRPIVGRDKVLRFSLGVRTQLPPGTRTGPAEVNGEPALVVHVDGKPDYVMTLVVDADGRVAEILLVAAPDKLAFARRQQPRLAGP
ncbi:MAG: sigma-70 family RNA polymerase sigma factor [Streptosporangiales bacterium]|nr:sigma-70 family RNA polymerase sigma factor [Streptosporangiales bacterium]